MEGLPPEEAFRAAFLEPLATVDGRSISGFDPAGNSLHRAFAFAHENGGQGRSVSGALKKLNMGDPAQADLARLLAPYSGQVNIYPPHPARFMDAPEGRLLPPAAEPQPVSFERAGPDGVDKDAAALAAESEARGSGEPTAKTGDELLAEYQEVQEMIARDEVPEEMVNDLRAADEEIDRLEGEKKGYEEAILCVMTEGLEG
jgi:hypothetical protein